MPYKAFANVYDCLMAGEKYASWQRLIENTIKKYKIEAGSPCIDLCCGTGNITQILIDLNLQPVGVDISGAMLKMAQEKLPKIKFYRQDIRNLQIRRGSFKFAASLYDSLNYILTDKEMEAAFKSSLKALSPGAIFLFDMNPREHVRVSQKNKPRIFQEQDFRAVFRFGGEKRIWSIDIDLSIKQRGGGYKIFHERHIERGYDIVDIAPILKKSGFELLETMKETKVYEDNRTHLSRLYFVARKPRFA